MRQGNGAFCDDGRIGAWHCQIPASRRKLELAAWLDKPKLAFGDRVLPFTGETSGYWAELCNRAESVGKTMAAFDSIIAATALEHGLGMVPDGDAQ